MEDLLNSITISDLPRHDRDVLSWFIKDATEPERVLQYVDEQHKDGGLPNLAYIVSLWKQVVTKVLQPAPSIHRVRSALFLREDHKCRITRQPSRYWGERLEAVSIVSPLLFDGVLSSEEQTMLLAFLGPEILGDLRALLGRIYNGQANEEEHPELQNLFLATKSMKDAFHKARYAFFPFRKLSWKPKELQPSPKTPDAIKYGIMVRQRDPECEEKIPSHFIHFTTPSTKNFPLPHPLLLGLHAKFSHSRAWMDLAEQRARGCSDQNIIYGHISGWISSVFIYTFKIFASLTPERMRHYFYHKLTRLCKKIYAAQGIVQRVPGGIIIKQVRGVSTNELRALQLANSIPGIPAPQVIDFVTDQGSYTYLVMSHIPGKQFRSVCGLMTDSDLSQFVLDLRAILMEMRKIQNPVGGGAKSMICGAEGNTPCEDFRLNNPCGPFPDLNTFHQQLRTLAYIDSSKINSADSLNPLTQKCLRIHTNSYPIFFTHGDINLTNILMNPRTLRISGLIDWECAGFYPEYWEKTKSVYSVNRDTFWPVVFPRVMPGFEEEIEVEKWLWNRSNPF